MVNKNNTTKNNTTKNNTKNNNPSNTNNAVGNNTGSNNQVSYKGRKTSGLMKVILTTAAVTGLLGGGHYLCSRSNNVGGNSHANVNTNVGGSSSVNVAIPVESTSKPQDNLTAIVDAGMGGNSSVNDASYDASVIAVAEAGFGGASADGGPYAAGGNASIDAGFGGAKADGGLTSKLDGGSDASAPVKVTYDREKAVKEYGEAFWDKNVNTLDVLKSIPAVSVRIALLDNDLDRFDSVLKTRINDNHGCILGNYKAICETVVGSIGNNYETEKQKELLVSLCAEDMLPKAVPLMPGNSNYLDVDLKTNLGKAFYQLIDINGKDALCFSDKYVNEHKQQ